MWKFDPLPSPSKLAPINAGTNASSSDNGNMGKYLTTSPPASTAPTSSDPPTPPNLYTDWQRRRSKGSFRSLFGAGIRAERSGQQQTGARDHQGEISRGGAKAFREAAMKFAVHSRTSGLGGSGGGISSGGGVVASKGAELPFYWPNQKKKKELSGFHHDKKEDDDDDNHVSRLVLDMAKFSSLHGVGWYAISRNTCFRATILLVSVALMLFMPLFIIYELGIYMSDDSVHQNLHTYRAESIDYPNITVCNPRFFKREYLRRHNISDELANYMLLALDTTARKHADFMSLSFSSGEHLARLNRLEAELQQVKREAGVKDLLELFHLVADRCEDFVMFCEEHRKFYVNDDKSASNSSRYSSCCSTFFHSSPFFTPVGTCFTTKTTVTETSPATYSNIRVWVYLDEDEAPEMDMVLLGMEAAERDGIFWTVTYEDHPSKTLFTKPRKLSMGTSKQVGISKRRIDRSKLPTPCLHYNDSWTERYGLPKTRLNCILALSHYTVPNCSMARYFGLKEVDGLRPCEPSDHLQLGTAVNKESTNLKKGKQSSYGFNYSECLYDCTHIFYDTDITSSRFNQVTLQKFFDSAVYGGGGEAGYRPKYKTSEAAMLQFYFESFDYEEFIIFEEGVDIFLSRVGGWMGLAQGGSFISLIEIFCFLFILVRALFVDCINLAAPKRR